MSEDRKPRFEISDGSNRVQLGVGNYLLALNAGDVYETADVAEVEALDKNAHVARTDKEPTRAHEAWDAESGPQPPDYTNPAAYVDEVPAESLEERFAGDAKSAIAAVNEISDRAQLDELEAAEKARSTPRTTVLTAIDTRRAALPPVEETENV